MACALCQRDLPLCRSHVIPEFFYKPLYDPSPKRFYAVSSDSEVSTLRRQSGEWERLLCTDCEGKFSRWERYVALLFGQAAPMLEPGEGRQVMRGIDYTQFRLFQLSVLWRASISTRPFFADVDLSPEHNEKLREMLLSENPGAPQEYGCWLLLCVPLREVLPEMMFSPDVFDRGGHTIGRFLFGGLMWNYHVTPPPAVLSKESVFITPSGALPIMLDDKACTKWVVYWMNRIKESGNFLEFEPDEDA